MVVVAGLDYGSSLGEVKVLFSPRPFCLALILLLSLVLSMPPPLWSLRDFFEISFLLKNLHIRSWYCVAAS